MRRGPTGHPLKRPPPAYAGRLVRGGLGRFGLVALAARRFGPELATMSFFLLMRYCQVRIWHLCMHGSMMRCSMRGLADARLDGFLGVHPSMQICAPFLKAAYRAQMLVSVPRFMSSVVMLFAVVGGGAAVGLGSLL